MRSDSPLTLHGPAAPLLDRRQWLGGGLGMLGAATMLAGAAPGADGSGGTHFAPRAKRVIHLFMNGGPFQADLFDPKPALTKYAGQKPAGANLVTERPTGGLLPSPFKYRPCGQSGVPVSELLPGVAKHIDDMRKLLLASVGKVAIGHDPRLHTALRSLQ